MAIKNEKDRIIYFDEKITTDISITNPSVNEITFKNCEINGSIYLDNATSANDISFINTAIVGNIDIIGLSLGECVKLESCSISGHCKITGATFPAQVKNIKIKNSSINELSIDNTDMSIGISINNMNNKINIFSLNKIKARSVYIGKSIYAMRCSVENSTIYNFDASGVIFNDGMRFKNNSVTTVAFIYSEFRGISNFDKTTFNGAASFANSIFIDDASFIKCTFNEQANFKKCEFRNAANFPEVTFQSKTNFTDANFFCYPPHFKAATLSERSLFDNVTWPQKTGEDHKYTIESYEKLRMEFERLKKHDLEFLMFEKECTARSLDRGGIYKLFVNSYSLLCNFGTNATTALILFLLITFLGSLANMLFYITDYPSSLWLSFASMTSVFGIRKDFVSSEDLKNIPDILKVIGAFQSIIGALLMFVVGLVIRTTLKMK